MATRLEDVFVVGRMPRITYNPRGDRGLEQAISGYLGDRGTILSVSGATKTGKTVLIRSMATGSVYLSGGVIETSNDMWEQVAEALGAWTEVSSSDSLTDTSSSDWNAGVVVAGIGGQRAGSEGSSSSRDSSAGRSISPQTASRAALSRTSGIVVIDDFHYVPRDAQLKIVRSLKDLVFDGLAVILVSVPHRAFDAVRVEKEMTGRVTHLRVEPWTEAELSQIAKLGFDALGVTDVEERLARRLAKESFASPHLMQEFCRRLCRANGVTTKVEAPTQLQAPADWQSFFRETATDTSKTAFDLLRTGPRQRKDRITRTLQDGQEVDIYGAVLAAVAHTGPRLEIGYEELRNALREVLSSDLPQRHEVTRVLEQMTQIAKEVVEGEPVLEYDGEMSTVHISDPFFAFYLRWGEVGEGVDWDEDTIDGSL